jgi:molybdopterin-binding protein
VSRAGRIIQAGTPDEVFRRRATGFVAVLTRQSIARLGLAEGEPAHVTFKASAAHVFSR